MKQAQNDLTALKEKQAAKEILKQKLDERADVWSTVIRWLIGGLLFAGIVYFIYWCVKYFDWIKENWTGFEIILGISAIVIPTLLIIFFLFKRTKISEETTVSFIEARAEKFLYWKHGFKIDDYNALCSEIEQKEIKMKSLSN